MKEFIEVTTVISMIASNIFALILVFWVIFAISFIASKLRRKPKPPKYKVICLVDLVWIIKITDKRLYYNHKTKQFGRLKEASQFDSYELAYNNMSHLE